MDEIWGTMKRGMGHIETLDWSWETGGAGLLQFVRISSCYIRESTCWSMFATNSIEVRKLTFLLLHKLWFLFSCVHPTSPPSFHPTPPTIVSAPYSNWFMHFESLRFVFFLRMKCENLSRKKSGATRIKTVISNKDWLQIIYQQ